ncbi:MAG: DUF4860 domain-containing protein [Lachnospiraceae bacterium]|nr:DUF4860 domain-containing protein [Lachnospiraceae bacterium]
MQNTNDEKKVKSRSALVSAGSTIIIIAFFAIAALVLLSAGTREYERIVLAANENFELRTSLSFVATKIRQYDSEGCVSVEKIDGTDVLVLREEIEGDIYDTMVYFRNGYLCELMQAEGYGDPDLDFGFEAIEIDSFEIKGGDGTITLSAGNAGGSKESLTVYLRSTEGAGR